jgi:hypothetical protein
VTRGFAAEAREARERARMEDFMAVAVLLASERLWECRMTAAL